MQEVVAREEIRDLTVRYNAYGDSGMIDEAVQLFVPDARLELVEGDQTAVYSGREAIARLLNDTKDAWMAAARSAGRPPYVRHFLSTHRVDFVDRTSARGRSYVAVVMAHGLDHWGRYLDAYRQVGGHWLIDHRRAITDGRRRS